MIYTFNDCDKLDSLLTELGLIHGTYSSALSTLLSSEVKFIDIDLHRNLITLRFQDEETLTKLLIML